MSRFDRLIHCFNDFCLRNYLKVIAIGVVLVALLFAGKLPYFNLVFTPKFIAFSCLALTVFLFSVGSEKLLRICLVFLGLALIFDLLNLNGISELMGELIYALLILAVLIRFVCFLRGIKRSK